MTNALLATGDKHMTFLLRNITIISYINRFLNIELSFFFCNEHHLVIL